MKKFIYNPTLDRLLLAAEYVQKGNMKKATKVMNEMLDYAGMDKDMTALDKMQTVAKQSEMAMSKPSERKGDYVRIWLFNSKESFIGQLISDVKYMAGNNVFAFFIAPKESFGRWLKYRPVAKDFIESACVWLEDKWYYNGDDQHNAKMPKKWNPPRNLK